MKKSILILGSILALSTKAFSSEGLFMREKFTSSIKGKPEIVAYMKDVVSISNRDNILADVIEPDENHHGLNFQEVTKQIFDHNYWTPKRHNFEDNKLEELFRGYGPSLEDIDDYNIFLANLLYITGSQFYKKTNNPVFLEYSAIIGHDKSQYIMYSITLKSRKPSEAKNYLLSAAAQGNNEALLKLSDIYQGGYQNLLKDFPKDIEMSKKLCQVSADCGNEQALFRINVATLTEGFFGSEINYQEGIKKAKELDEKGNKRAKDFVNAIMLSSGESLMEGNESITSEDLNFLSAYLGWQDSEGEV